jgi:hypothetical protein
MSSRWTIGKDDSMHVRVSSVHRPYSQDARSPRVDMLHVWQGRHGRIDAHPSTAALDSLDGGVDSAIGRSS